MTASDVIIFVIYLVVAAIMVGIGISQLKSLSPVGFYTGERPPKEDELTDVQVWNKKHGMMWMIYGIIIISSYFGGLGLGYLTGDSILFIIPLCGGTIVPIIVMCWYHHKLIKKYKR